MKKYLTLLAGFLCFVALSALTDDPFAEMLKKLDQFVKKNPQEKVYLHLDKPYYAIGDDIWFKAYVVDTRTSLPTTTSNILYVELINSRDSVAKQLKLPMQSGITWGDFRLPDALSEGNYRIRAYTQWMRNGDPLFFFDKTIKIGNGWTNKIFTNTNFQYQTANGQDHLAGTIKLTNASSTPYSNAEISYHTILGAKKSENIKTLTDANGEIKVKITNDANNPVKNGFIVATIKLADGYQVKKYIPIKTTSTGLDVQFFPEGGNLIEGLPNKVAVKAVNKEGKGEDISGVITDNDGIEVLSFDTFHLGMGSFSINPAAGKTYTAKIKSKYGERTVALPKAQASGYALAVNNVDSAKMNIKVMLSPNLLDRGELNLLAQRNGIVLFSGKVPSSKQIVSIVVPKTDFPSGIVTITLFDQQNEPVAERLAFVNNANDKIEATINGLKDSYTKKGSVDLTMNLANKNKPVQGSFSVAVTNVNMVHPDLNNESHILTSLLLTSDLKGYVENPNYYFLKNDIDTKIALDHLLLTQGWRKINWKSVINNEAPAIRFPAEKSMKLSGTITDNGKPVEKGKVSLFSSSQGIFATDTETDANGKFVFDQIAFNDSTRFAIKAITSSKSKSVKIIMDDLPSQAVTLNPNAPAIETNINEALKDYLNQSAAYFKELEAKGFLTRVNLLNTVEVIGKASKASPNSANLNGPGQADDVFGADDLKNATSLAHYLQGRVPGLKIANGLPYSAREESLMTVIMDGSTIIDGQAGEAGVSSQLDDVNILDIESIEVLRTLPNRALYGHAGTNGVIVITSKTGKTRDASQLRAPGMLSYAPKGFHTAREFYTPKNDVKQDNQYDLRTTVFWEPHLVSDATGKAALKFANADQAGTYRIIIEGFDGDGNLLRKVISYQVK